MQIFMADPMAARTPAPHWSRPPPGRFKLAEDIRICPERLFIPDAACYRPSPTPHRGQIRRRGFASPAGQPYLHPGGRGELAMPKKPNGQPNGGLELALTFDDVLLKPGLSEVLPS